MLVTRKRPRLIALAAILTLAVTAHVAAGGSAESPEAASREASRRASQAANAAIATHTVTDDLGNTMVVPVQPERILSTTLFSDEVLLEILSADRFAAVASLSRSEVYSNVAERAAAVEPVVEFTAEPIIALSPDLVIAANWSEPEIVTQLRAAAIPVYQIDTPVTLDGIAEAIERLGRLTNAAAEAQNLVQEMRARADALAARVATIPEGARPVALDYNNWGTANGADTTWQVVLDLAGVTNGAAPFAGGDFGQVPLSKEMVVEINPDILFIPGYIWGEAGAAEAFEEQVRADPALQSVAAVETDMVIAFPERLKGTYSHFLIDAAELVHRLAYPDGVQ
jgi:iron complex transport system substrate-binding protein